ncbi:hypothetical protein AVEN_54709-1 [Araneus ventricosus]|uniref:Uncharacterized protein n=1 Tax=Araneus ventricosus TaxID=182803 RepID=A0A4Y2HCM5_ARAVE|nr:hypothetical protein AVEN_54709-1 [Araneus ventricosus]
MFWRWRTPSSSTLLTHIPSAGLVGDIFSFVPRCLRVQYPIPRKNLRLYGPVYINSVEERMSSRCCDAQVSRGGAASRLALVI